MSSPTTADLTTSSQPSPSMRSVQPMQLVGTTRDVRGVRERIAGLDGLRALAVTGVVVYHAFPRLLPGGFIGVDVFFVISGFLITGNLLQLLQDGERRDGRLRKGLRHFLGRRARRILPPLVPLLVVVGLLVWALGRGSASGLTDGYTRQVLGALTFSSNWVAIASSQSYFLASAPAVLKNLWSLAVEEQFYLVWPLVLVLLLKLSRRRRLTLTFTAALVSAATMALLAEAEDPSRSYYGTDTHMFGLLLGAAVAFALGERDAEPGPSAVSPSVSPSVISPDRAVGVYARTCVRAALVCAGLMVLGMAMRSLQDQDLWTYRGGLLVVAAVTALVVAALARGVGGLGQLLDAGVLGAVGRRSYGIYLWHWPLLVIAEQVSPVAWRSHVPGHLVVLAAVAAAVGCAWLSYRYLERPLLRRAQPLQHPTAVDTCTTSDARTTDDITVNGINGTGRDRAGLAASARRTTSLVSACLLAIGSVTFLAASGPGAASTAQEQINRGEAAIAAHRQQHTPGATPRGSAPTSAPTPTSTSSLDKASGTTPRTTNPSDGPSDGPSAGVSDDTSDGPLPTAITALGDSVMLASAPELFDVFPSASVDAKVSRQPWDAPALLRALAAQGRLQPVVVVSLGTNGAYSRSVLDAMRTAIGHRHLVLVTAYADRPWVAGDNQLISAYATEHSSVTIADWNRAISTRPSLLGPDGVHPSTAGGRLYADVIADAVRAADRTAEESS